ncbi:MAG: ATP-binding protein [Dehalococcoidia bacterium]
MEPAHQRESSSRRPAAASRSPSPGTSARLPCRTPAPACPRLLPHIFERFRQADASTTRRHSGLGIGLAIVQHLVERHGGAVSATSAGEGHGATFTVGLPAAAVAGARTNGHGPATAAVPAPDALAGAACWSWTTTPVHGRCCTTCSPPPGRQCDRPRPPPPGSPRSPPNARTCWWWISACRSRTAINSSAERTPPGRPASLPWRSAHACDEDRRQALAAASSAI